MRQRGQSDSAFVLQKLFDDPNIATQLKSFICQQDQPDTKKTPSPVKCAALILDKNLSKSAYNGVREASPDLVPYYLTQIERLKCRPANIITTPTDVSVSMQNLSQHTATRILEDKDVSMRLQELYESAGTDWLKKLQTSL